jgi:hypothetical protein
MPKGKWEWVNENTVAAFDVRRLKIVRSSSLMPILLFITLVCGSLGRICALEELAKCYERTESNFLVALEFTMYALTRVSPCCPRLPGRRCIASIAEQPLHSERVKYCLERRDPDFEAGDDRLSRCRAAERSSSIIRMGEGQSLVAPKPRSASHETFSGIPTVAICQDATDSSLLDMT